MAIGIVILAAGKGTRMKSNTPKVLHTISGKPMLFHSIDVAKSISDDITIILNHQAELIKERVTEVYDGIKFHIQDVANFPGTGGALRGVELADKKTLILNGDMPLLTKEALDILLSTDTDIAMSVIELEDPSGYGRVSIENGKVQKIIEEKDCTPHELNIKSVNAGIYAIKSEILKNSIPKLSNDNAQKEYYLTDIIEMGVHDGLDITAVYGKEELFKGVNSKIDLADAEVIHQRRIKEAWMAQDVTMRLPESIYIESSVELEGECIIENGVTLLGKTKIINAHIKTNSIIEDALINESSIGPMARIRPQSDIKRSHIGNFVEVKKSTLTGVKAGHLSYLGDSRIDEGSNIGAGVITCNYDGKAKYQTSIGKNVFVGSDSQLIAPLKIEDDVFIAAGSTITKNVKKGSLAMTRAPQKIIADFFYKFFGSKK